MESGGQTPSDRVCRKDNGDTEAGGSIACTGGRVAEKRRLFSDEYCMYGEFTGTFVGLTCADRVKHRHYADFDFFEYKDDMHD